jgi:hypothetical protein
MLKSACSVRVEIIVQTFFIKKCFWGLFVSGTDITDMQLLQDLKDMFMTASQHPNVKNTLL